MTRPTGRDERSFLPPPTNIVTMTWKILAQVRPQVHAELRHWIDRARKMRIYAREGVGHLWFLDPVARTLEIYRLEEGRWVVVATYGGDDGIRAEPFEAVTLTMRRWWLEG